MSLSHDSGASLLSAGDVNAVDFGEEESFTISFWLKLSARQSTTLEFMRKKLNSTAATSAGFNIYGLSSGSFIVLIADGTIRAYWPVGPATHNDFADWTLVTFVLNRDTDTGSVYINSVLANDSASDGPVSAMGSIANDQILTLRCLDTEDVSLDDFRFYKRALSQEDIDELYLAKEAKDFPRKDYVTTFSTTENKLDRISVYRPDGSIQTREVALGRNPSIASGIRTNFDVENLDS